MPHKIKMILPISLIGLFALATVASGATEGVITGSTYAISSNTNYSTLTSGSLISGQSTGASAISFGSKAIDVSTTIPPIVTADYIRVDDNTGKNAGWNATVSATSLTTTVTDATMGAPNTVTVSIPAEKVLKVSASNPRPLNNAKAQAQTVAGPLVVNVTGAGIMSAAKSQGAGSYTGDLSYTLTWPNYLPAGTTVTTSNASSPIKTTATTDVTQLGLFAGTYTTTITYSIIQAP